jgi:hypothetical protein
MFGGAALDIVGQAERARIVRTRRERGDFICREDVVGACSGKALSAKTEEILVILHKLQKLRNRISISTWEHWVGDLCPLFSRRWRKGRHVPPRHLWADPLQNLPGKERVRVILFSRVAWCQACTRLESSRIAAEELQEFQRAGTSF